MNAQHVLAHIAAYRELNPTERGAVDQHVASCQTCAQALAQTRQVDALLSSLPRLRPTAAQDLALRQRLAAAPDAARRPVWPRIITRQPQWARLIVVMLLVALLSTTGVVAAQSLPDSPLYNLKLAAEQARSLVTVDPTAQADWQLVLARTRLDEITLLVDQGRIPSAAALSRLNWQFDRAAAAATHAPAQDTYRLLSAADELNGLAVLRLDAWLRALPPSAQPVLARTLSNVRTTQQVVQDGLASPENFRLPDPSVRPVSTPTPTDTPTPTPTATQSPSPIATPTPLATDTPESDPTLEATATETFTPTPLPPATATPEPTATRRRVRPRPTATASVQPIDSPTPRPTRTRRVRPTPTASVQPIDSPTPRPTRTRRFRPTPTSIVTGVATVEPLPTRVRPATATPRAWPTPAATETPAVTTTPAVTASPENTPIVIPPRRTPPWIPPRRR